ncbi:MAG: B12-binding domain-containing radical SAM protein [Lachnospiraceae bacterium]|nr:B12-binding domain-containing radical SAM protein [Lachnospiraceae bacterium]
MKFLLVAINAKYIHSNPAVHSLYAYAGEDLQKHIEIAEYTINNYTQDILADIYKRKPGIIGFSCYIWNFGMIMQLLPDLKKVLPDTDIWLGGPEVSFCTQEFFEEYPMVKGIMAGEGEETFRELLTCYITQNNHLESVAGLILPTGSTGLRELLSMDEIPFLYENMEGFQNKIVYYESARGCPFRCSYCLSSVDKTVRLRNMDTVKRELQFFLDHSLPQVKFIDRTFNCNHGHAMEIWRYIKEHDNGVTNFHFEIAADIMTEEEIELLAEMRPGLVQLEIGVQSTNEKTLREINRFVNTDHIKRVVAKLRRGNNIHIHLDLIAGLPYENYESFKKSFDEVYQMKPEQLQLGFLKVLKGSPMEEKAKEYGILYSAKPPYEVLATSWLSYEEILSLKQVEEMVEIYYNSNQFRQTLKALEICFDTPYELFRALADYYAQKGYFTQTPARAYRYRILLDFACDVDNTREELYRELLTYDFYLRENAKSRPEFAGNVDAYYQDIWSFYQWEEENGVYLSEYQGYHARQTMKMTHMEVFRYPVWEEEPEKMYVKTKNMYYVLFDYKKKNALTGDGMTTAFEEKFW